MRRIPRTSRAVDPYLSISPLVHRCASPLPCRIVCAPRPHFRTTTAAFSNTSSRASLTDNKDKKRYQQSIRRWQKRLTGDSEPIGSHVDPYDATSPVRIAPEEQGEEEEVLVDETGRESRPGEVRDVGYREADEESVLKRVGGVAWLEKMEETELAKEFEKLTLRTYTPLNFKMADRIEKLTGTFFTLRDDNLKMADIFQEETGKPYTEYSFGRFEQIKDPVHLREKFHQAVVETYTLHQAGKDMNIAAFTNRGIYEPPAWIHDVTFTRSQNRDLELAFPSGKTAKQLLDKMQEVPEWNPASDGKAVGDELFAEEGEVVEALEPELPTMDPDTPPARRAALVKQDPDAKPFDFMSNRPVPRAKPVEETPRADELIENAETVRPKAAPQLEFNIKVQASESAISQLRHMVYDSLTQSSEGAIASVRQTLRDTVTVMASESTTVISEPSSKLETKWRHVPLTNPKIKFALAKRLLQLTGLRISDPSLNHIYTLGDLYCHLSSAAKPQPAKLFDFIQQESEKVNTLPIEQPRPVTTRSKKRTSTGDLSNLGNVEIHGKRITPRQERRRIGLDKVVTYALRERDLVREKKSELVQET
ncbi:hypothetical protein BDV95DRAFT_530387 [Massariosphaeria phaeospora]|uniref:Large ribosomal subunit protein mL50 n=1 Tax=Massariosphaeria phaeospora TaxID=100035 RepID=A0A7C8M268_9PLEO|nr:hypothetical protein BDV95DRAFT_530387 [Massariosphaeria phaeospora]